MISADVTIRPARDDDFDGIWRIFQTVTEAGEAFSYGPDTTRDDLHRHWLSHGHHPFVAHDGDSVLGASFIRANQPGLGDHVANAGFMVAPEARGSGIGKKLGRHALDEARRLGFLAMQFNFVVSTNQAAVNLWKQLGFAVIGVVPQGFRHPKLGYVDVYIMHRFLQ